MLTVVLETKRLTAAVQIPETESLTLERLASLWAKALPHEQGQRFQFYRRDEKDKKILRRIDSDKRLREIVQAQTRDGSRTVRFVPRALEEAHENCAVSQEEKSSAAEESALNGEEMTMANVLSTIRLYCAEAVEQRVSPLFLACERGDVAGVQALLLCICDIVMNESEEVQRFMGKRVKDRVNAVERKKDFRTPLHIAAEKGFTEIVSLLIAHSANVNSKDKHEWTPLLLAAENGHTKVVSQLLVAGANRNSKNGFGCTPLHNAAYKGHVKVADLLLKAKASLGSMDKKMRTPLHLAASNNRTEMVSFLISKGANIEAEDRDGHTPLALAQFKGNSETVHLLLRSRADLFATCELKKLPATDLILACVREWCSKATKKQVSPLFLASKRGDTNAVRALLQCTEEMVQHESEEVKSFMRTSVEERVNHRESMKENLRTPLHVAAQGGFLDIVCLLVAHLADVDVGDKDELTPLFLAAKLGHAEVVSHLLLAGAFPNSIDPFGCTPLHFAANLGNMEVAKLLIQAEANIHSRDEDMHTPLHLAVMKNHTEMVAFLISEGANIEARDKDGYSPLAWAALLGHVEMVSLLLTSNADIEATDLSRSTPLHIAVNYEHKEIARLLVDSGADLHAEDQMGEIPYWIVARWGLINASPNV